MSKVLRAKIMLWVASVIGVGVGLTALWWIGVFFVWWYTVHFVSFAIIVGTIGGVGALLALFNGIEWAMSVLDDAKKEEEKEQKRREHEKKLEAYREKYGQDSSPRKASSSGFDDEPRYLWDNPPRIDMPNRMNAG